MGDKHGDYFYLGRRCTIQRRRQKLIEEAPSPKVDESLRKKMGECAVQIVKTTDLVLGAVKFSMRRTTSILWKWMRIQD